MNINWKRIDKLLGYVLMVSLVGWMIYYAVNRSYLLNNYTRYTFGTMVDRHRAWNLGIRLIYKYQVNGKVYKGHANEKDGIVIQSPGGRYYVKFSSKKPSVSELIQDHAVPDSIKQAPSEGWKEQPWPLSPEEIFKPPFQ